MSMVMKKVTVKLDGGLEARPAAELVQIASQFDSSVYLEAEGRKVNAKSIMGMMSLGLARGEHVTVQAEGEDQESAVDRMSSYLSGQKQNN